MGQVTINECLFYCIGNFIDAPQNAINPIGNLLTIYECDFCFNQLSLSIALEANEMVWQFFEIKYIFMCSNITIRFLALTYDITQIKKNTNSTQLQLGSCEVYISNGLA